MQTTCLETQAISHVDHAVWKCVFLPSDTEVLYIAA